MSRKWVRKKPASPNAPQSAAALSIAVLRESENSHRFSTSAVCPVILHPIALPWGRLGGDPTVYAVTWADAVWAADPTRGMNSRQARLTSGASVYMYTLH